MATKQPRIRHALVLMVVGILALCWSFALASASPVNVSPRLDSLLYNTTQSEINNTADIPKRRKRSKRKHIPSDDSGEKNRPSTKQKETGGREAATLRRIKREWRDAVKLGIAYDWQNAKSLGTPSAKYSHVRIGPIGKNLLRWHFSVAGPPSSEYQGGIYHGRVLLPKDYPGSPPRIQVLTPSGRFICGQDICLSASSFHPETWTPQWTVLSLVEALRLHMLTTANEIGGKDDTPEQRRKYARASRTWHLGRIDHGRMVREGIFPWQQDGDTIDQVESKTVVVDSVDAGDVQVAVTTKQRTRQETAPVARKRVLQKTSVPAILFRAVVEVLTSPVRLGILFFLTVFALLNRK